jgi:hypothetical protein
MSVIEEAFSSQKRPSNTSKHELLQIRYCLLLWVIFALLDPDPDSEYGSGSTDPIEYGSDPDHNPGYIILFKFFDAETSRIFNTVIMV